MVQAVCYVGIHSKVVWSGKVSVLLIINDRIGLNRLKVWFNDPSSIKKLITIYKSIFYIGKLMLTKMHEIGWT